MNVRYGDTAELAAAILEEGDNSPADVFFAQDAGALGALSKEDRFAPLPEEILTAVPPSFVSPSGEWVGISGRARVVVYNTEEVSESDLPDSVLDFTDPRWRGRIGWAPTNGSFQAFVTALRVMEGDDAARAWLEGIKANDPQEYPKNTPIVQAAAAGEIDVGFVNHYYLLKLASEDASITERAANHFPPGGDPGSLVNVAGAGILTSSGAREAAERFVTYLLDDEAQRYFADETFEYPLVAGIPADDKLPPIDEIEAPQIDLSDLEDLQGTLRLLNEVGVL